MYKFEIFRVPPKGYQFHIKGVKSKVLMVSSPYRALDKAFHAITVAEARGTQHKSYSIMEDDFNGGYRIVLFSVNGRVILSNAFIVPTMIEATHMVRNVVKALREGIETLEIDNVRALTLKSHYKKRGVRAYGGRKSKASYTKDKNKTST